MALETNTAAASECGSPALRYDAVKMDFLAQQWEFANHIVIPLSSFAKTLNLYQSVCLHFLHNHCFAFWSTTCQKCDSVMSSQSKPISRPLEFNTQTCASALQRGAIKWLGVQARTVMPWTRWRTSADTQSTTTIQASGHTQRRGTLYTLAVCCDRSTDTQCRDVQVDYRHSWTTEKPTVSAALLTLGHWDNYQGSRHSILPWVMWRIEGWKCLSVLHIRPCFLMKVDDRELEQEKRTSWC